MTGAWAIVVEFVVYSVLLFWAGWKFGHQKARLDYAVHDRDRALRASLLAEENRNLRWEKLRNPPRSSADRS